MPKRPHLTPRRRARVLEAIAQGHTDTRAAELAGVGRHVIRDAKKRDEQFLADYMEAYEAGLEPMLDEARRRAVDGVEDFRLDKHGEEHPLRVYSDNLLMFLIKQRDNSFRENHRVELAGAAGAPLVVEVNGGRVTSLSDVFELARAVGAGLRDGLGTGPAGDAVPAAPNVRAALGPAAD